MDNRAVGVFDSGLGGLTAVKELMALMPHESIVYFGDTGRVPYGNKSEETVIKYAVNDIRFLLTHNVKMIVIACGTVSSIALSTVKHQFDLPIIGVVDTAAAAATAATRNGKIGVIGTQSTIKTGAYEAVIASLAPTVKTVSAPCPLFVPLVENGYITHDITYTVAKEYLEPLIENQVDTLILGCTHYPLLTKVIGDVMGDKVTLINSGAEVAKHVKNVMDNENTFSDTSLTGQYKYYVSDSIEGFSELGSRFLNRRICGSVEKIDIEKY